MTWAPRLAALAVGLSAATPQALAVGLMVAGSSFLSVALPLPGPQSLCLCSVFAAIPNATILFSLLHNYQSVLRESFYYVVNFSIETKIVSKYSLLIKLLLFLHR